jgi:hypothetical protein
MATVANPDGDKLKISDLSLYAISVGDDGVMIKKCPAWEN